jgi:hypothetical protein
MSASRKIVVLATLVAFVSAVAAGAANAEPKNVWPFTRPADSRVLGQAVRVSAAVDVAPVPEAKNQLPFTRRMAREGASASTGNSIGTLAGSGGDSGGVDWALVGWGFAAALTLAGGTAVALSSRRLPPHSRA